jgi:DNA-binding transcriptional regulator GbsR (MarR family)
MSRPSPSDEFVDRASSELAAQGFPRMPAKVIMALTASEDGRMTVAELAEQLEVSPAAISGAIRYLITVGFVRSSTVPGSRRHVYALPETAWYASTLHRPGLYQHVESVLRSSAGKLPESAARDRIEEMADFFGFLDERLPELLAEWEHLRSQRREAAVGD